MASTHGDLPRALLTQVAKREVTNTGELQRGARSAELRAWAGVEVGGAWEESFLRLCVGDLQVLSEVSSSTPRAASGMEFSEVKIIWFFSEWQLPRLKDYLHFLFKCTHFTPQWAGAWGWWLISCGRI